MGGRESPLVANIISKSRKHTSLHELSKLRCFTHYRVCVCAALANVVGSTIVVVSMQEHRLPSSHCYGQGGWKGRVEEGIERLVSQ